MTHTKEKPRTEAEKRQRNKYDRAHPEKVRESHLKCKYGITLAGYDALLKKQKGVCAICKLPYRGTNVAGKPRRLDVDHCHKTGQIRGLLCNGCNQGIAFFFDKEDLLPKARAYILKAKRKNPLSTKGSIYKQPLSKWMIRNILAKKNKTKHQSKIRGITGDMNT